MRIILDLCGGSGAWSKPYLDFGYEVDVVTIPGKDVRSYEPPSGGVYGILAAPPCTQFSLARTRAKQPRDLKAGMEIVEACLKIIWKCHLISPLKFWAMENPRGLLRGFLGYPFFTFEQWEFGDAGVKPTDLWGRFNPPRKVVKKKPDGLTQRFPNGKTNSKGWSKSSDLRSVTPPGFAWKFFEANQ